MIARIPTPVTKKQESVVDLRSRISSELLEQSEPGLRSARGHSNNHGPAQMGTLQHLLCGCLGMSCLTLFMGVINVIVNSLFQQTSTFSLSELLWMCGR